MTKVNINPDSPKAIPYWENVLAFAKKHRLPFFTLRNRNEAAMIMETEEHLPSTVQKIERIITSCTTQAQIVHAINVAIRFREMFSNLHTISDIKAICKRLEHYAFQREGEIVLGASGLYPYNDSDIHPEWNQGLVTDSEGPE